MRSLKSVLGSSLAHEKTRIKARSIGFMEIIGLFLGHLRKKLEEDGGDLVETLVLGRPVQFVDDDAEADANAQSDLEKAAHAQGFKHIAFQFEPIAAALDYEQRVTREELALIIDMGGGTSDFSVGAFHRSVPDPWTARTISWPAGACTLAAPISTGCSVLPM